MSVEVSCGCGAVFDANDRLAGGVTNCPSCGRAVDVPGLRDPAWRAIQALALVAVAGVGAVAYARGGVGAAAIAILIAGAALWLISRAL